MIDHADELAKRFEEYEPERQIVDAVTAARARNLSWQRIGALLGTSAWNEPSLLLVSSMRAREPME